MAIQQTFLRGYGGAVYDWGGDRGVFAGGWVQAQGPASKNIQYMNLAGSAGGTSSSFVRLNKDPITVTLSVDPKSKLAMLFSG